MKKTLLLMTVLAGTLAACDEHIEFPDNTMKVGHILCTDGNTYPYSDSLLLHKEPIAVVFSVNNSESIEGMGYAVYLYDLAPEAFSDSIGVKQGTSADEKAHDGRLNTFLMHTNNQVGSPAADAVFRIWRYAQSAYIPSVEQMRLLYKALDDYGNKINGFIEKCGGDVISKDADGCWFWTSTEVQKEEVEKAWLFSLSSGAVHDTPKDECHKIRPIVTIKK